MGIPVKRTRNVWCGLQRARARTRKILCGQYRAANSINSAATKACAVSVGGEKQWTWVRRMKRYVAKEKRSLRKSRNKCLAAARAVIRPKSQCRKWNGIVARRPRYCDPTLSMRWVAATCSLKQGLRDMCKFYSTCYKVKKASYLKLVNRTATD